MEQTNESDWELNFVLFESSATHSNVSRGIGL